MLLNKIRSKLNDFVRRPDLPERRPVGAAVATKREPAPVVMYFEKDRNQRQIERVRELLHAKKIPFTPLDVTGDPATLAFVMREAGCEDDDLPIVFVAGAPVGGLNELVDWDVSGKLASAVFGGG